MPESPSAVTALVVALELSSLRQTERVEAI